MPRQAHAGHRWEMENGHGLAEACLWQLWLLESPGPKLHRPFLEPCGPSSARHHTLQSWRHEVCMPSLQPLRWIDTNVHSSHVHCNGKWCANRFLFSLAGTNAQVSTCACQHKSENNSASTGAVSPLAPADPHPPMWLLPIRVFVWVACPLKPKKPLNEQTAVKFWCDPQRLAWSTASQQLSCNVFLLTPHFLRMKLQKASHRGFTEHPCLTCCIISDVPRIRIRKIHNKNLCSHFQICFRSENTSYHRRKFRSEASDHIDRWKSTARKKLRQGDSQKWEAYHKRTRFLEDLGCKPWISESFSFDTGCFRESDCLSKRETEPEDDLTKDKREVRRRGKAYVASSSWTMASARSES